MAVTYINTLYDYVLDPLRDLFIEEYNYGKIYIAPQIQHKDPFSIRIWAENITTHEYLAGAWTKQYNVEIFMYHIEANPSEGFYRQFYNDLERIYQLLFISGKAVSTTISGGSGNTTTSVTEVWYDGKCDEVVINEFAEGEDEIEGLNEVKFIFNCKIMREV
tara:strand:- start:3567 stop:4052 length:486 start_codon:yes stop_codon:yes gene_type:complete